MLRQNVPDSCVLVNHLKVISSSLLCLLVFHLCVIASVIVNMLLLVPLCNAFSVTKFNSTRDRGRSGTWSLTNFELGFKECCKMLFKSFSSSMFDVHHTGQCKPQTFAEMPKVQLCWPC